MNAPKPPKVEELQLNPLQRQLIDEAAKHNGVMAQDIIDKMWGSAQRLKNQSPTSPAAPNGQAPSANPESPAPGASGGASGGPPGAPVPPQGRPGDQRRGDIPANIDTASLVDEAIRTGRMTIDVPGLGRVSTEGLPTEALQAIQTAMRNVAPHITPAAFRMAYSGGDNSQLPTGGADSMQISKSRVDAIDRSPVGTIIDRVARETGLDPAMMKAIAHIESSGNPRAVTGSYRGLYQLSNEEFSRYGRGGDVFNAEDNAYAAAGSLKEKMARFRVNFGRDPSATELYLMHQQGEGGLRMHATHLDRPAWENMLATGEGKRKGEAWAKKAVWGNVPSDVRRNFDRDSMTSREFIAVWMSKIEGIPYRTALARVGGSKNTEVASR